MGRSTNEFQLWELLSCPAFSVKNGLIDTANSAARGLLIQPGTPVASMLRTGKEDYLNLVEGGCLSVVVETEASQFYAYVCRHENMDVFLLDQDYEDPVQNAFSMAACNMRQSLGMVLDGVQALQQHPNSLDPEAEKYIRAIYKGAFKMLRQVSNMSAVTDFTKGITTLDALDIEKELREITMKIGAFLEDQGIAVTFSSNFSDMIVMADAQKIERALHNLISNAAAHPSLTEAPQIHVELKEVKDCIHLVVTDNGQGISDDVFSTLFCRYLRNPYLNSNNSGLGQGLSLVRAAAIAHGGTVLVERLSPSGTRVTMTIQQIPYNSKLLRSPRLTPDYLGGFDHVLVEFSDLLPPEIYGKK